MIDIKLIRENRDVVKENIKKKFQDEKLELVDKVYDLDVEYRECKNKGDNLRSEKNKLSSSIGQLMREKKTEEAEKAKKQVTDMQEEIKKIMMVIPIIIDESFPIGKDYSENVEVERFGEPVVPKY